jgi:uncharacterized protein (DUF2235 family)
MALYAFDGTWNREHTGADYNENSNVVRFAQRYNAPKAVYQKKGDQNHIVEDSDTGYISGPGTRHGIAGGIFGGLAGFGGKTRVKEAIERAKRKFAQGDRVIDVVGFSRGAAIALHFVNDLAETDFAGGFKPRVRFLGLWDVVAAFGIPRDIGNLKCHETNLGWKLTLPRNVDHCFHAIALDERRASFRVTRVDRAYEVWFRGVHSDVGGGNGNIGLSDITLRWMLRKAIAVGLPIKPNAFADLKANAAAPVLPSKKDLIKDPFRPLRPKDCRHHTLTIRSHADCQNPPAGWVVEDENHEKSRTRLVI